MELKNGTEAKLKELKEFHRELKKDMLVLLGKSKTMGRETLEDELFKIYMKVK